MTESEGGEARGRERALVVVVAEDDQSDASVIAAALGEAGFRVEIEARAESRAGLAGVDTADLVIANRDSPRIRRLVGDLVRRRRRPPIMLLSREATARVIAESLDAGAEDYLVKPVHPIELAARVRAVLRRTRPAPALGKVEMAGVVVDLDRRIASRAGKRIALSRVEWRLLEQLALEEGSTVSHETLLSTVWGLHRQPEGNWLRIWIGRLRRRLGLTGRPAGGIVTVPGVGYRLDAASPAGDERAAERRRIERAAAAADSVR